MKALNRHTGIVKFFNVGRLYGFITDEKTGREYFCHNNGLACHIKKGDRVKFDIADCLKGKEAVNVELIENSNLLNIRCDGYTKRTA